MKIERQKAERLVNRFFLYFFRGILLIAPLGATFYLISRILKKIDTLASFGIPGLGMFIIISSITLLGYIGSTLLIQTVFNFTESFIKKIPFLIQIIINLYLLVQHKVVLIMFMHMKSNP